jgi:murein DD-endopeptidase MepM/ murein hydrolase activator NlpD
MGAFILETANAYGVSAPQMLAQFLKESELGTTAGPNKILSGITDPGKDQGLGNQRAFEGFATWQDAITAHARLLSTSDYYRGKSLQEQIGNWYVGPEEYKRNGINATDKAGNGTVADYLNLVSQVYAALGVPLNATTAPTRTGSPAAGYVPTPGMKSIWGGVDAEISQEFGSTEYSNQNPYNYGADFGQGSGHHGLDIGVQDGTNLYIPNGVTGEVIIAGGSGYFKDSRGDGPGRGELRIRLDNGHILILGHMSGINLRVGQRVTAGMLAGRSGTADGDHLHLEYRVPDSSLNSGWRAVDPRAWLK